MNHMRAQRPKSSREFTNSQVGTVFRTQALKIVEELSPRNDAFPEPSPENVLKAAGSNRHVRTRVRRSEQWIERLALAVLVVGFVVKAFIPAWTHLNSDFPNYYLVARLYRAGYPLERVYDWIWLQRQNDHLGIQHGLVSFIPSTIPSALAVAPWCSLPPLAAKHRWLMLNVVLVLFTGFLLCRITKLRWEHIAMVIFLAWIPLRNSFLFGQMHLLVLFLLTLAIWLFIGRFRFLAGITLAVAATLKIYPVLFLIYFAWKRQWRAAAGLVLGVMGAAVASICFFGKDVCRLYLDKVLPAGLRGESLDPYNPAWNSWTALLRRLFIAEPELNPSPVAHLPWLYALLHPLIHAFVLIMFLWAIGSQRSDAERTKLEWAAFLFVLLFLSSQPGSYHFVALILTAALVLEYLLSYESWPRIAFVAAVYALINGPAIRFPWVTPTGWQNILFFPRLGLMTIFGCLLFLTLIPQSRELLQARFSSKNTVIAGVIFVVLVTIGFAANERHLIGQFENYDTRIATAPGDLVASGPATSRAGILFTKMMPTGYSISRVHAGSILDFRSPGGDLFHATSTDQTSSLPSGVWAEEASVSGSRIVRLGVGADIQQDSLVTTVENAEEPVVSADGRLLAFLRSNKGRNSLWIRVIGGQFETSVERQIAGEDYDVHDATFLTDHRVIFSSKQNGGFRLYIATQAGVVEELKYPTCSARYPAVSPDGYWLAFNCEQNGSAQIHVMKWPKGADFQLTTADCNSISPAWTADSKRLIYATDCGRGLGLTALAELHVLH